MKLGADSRCEPNQFVLILGPCSLESKDLTRTVAEIVAEVRDENPGVRVVFKGSFDKANRTSLEAPRGPGLEEGLALLQWVKEQYHLETITDVHLPQHVPTVASVVDVLQIPAFLCRQTDLLVAAGQTKRVVSVKKGQFLSPQEMEFVVHKLRASGASEIWATERGTAFGYQNLVVDMRSFQIMEGFGARTIFDATHSVQLPGAGGGKTTGNREFVAPLAKAAVAAGAQGLFLETHPTPECAISDGPNQIPLSELKRILSEVFRVRSAIVCSEHL